MRSVRIITVALLLLAGCISATAQRHGVYGVAFYNLENLFDTEPDESIGDHDFTPTGAYNWTQDKYRKKLDNMATVISRLAREYCPVGPTILGVAEIENRRVLEDLVANEKMADMGYEIVHYDSPDRRGVDVALLYNPRLFQVVSSTPYPFRIGADSLYRTRDQLLVSGYMDGEPVNVIVNHWPSRYGGKQSPIREYAAAITKHIADSIYNADPTAHIIIIGDLNDDPVDSSVRTVLGAKKRQNEVKPGGLFNPMWAFYDRGIGSLSYQGKWSLFDQIIVSQSLLGDKEHAGLKYWKAEIFNRDFLIQKDGKNKGYPLRTFSGNAFINGYSDHFPVLIYLTKQL